MKHKNLYGDRKNQYKKCQNNNYMNWLKMLNY